MKKNYTFSLEEEKVERLKTVLAKGNMSFSGFINTFISETVDTLEDSKIPDDVENMTLGEFFAAFSRVMTGARK